MQLTGTSSLRGALTAVTAALIGGGFAHAAGNNKLESSVLLYSETDRVQAAEGIVSLTHAFTGNRLLSGRFTFDALTGPSPNGAAPANRIQTFTRPSGAGSYTVKPGKTPLDDTFRDTRLSFDGSFTQPLDRLTNLILGAHLSTEHDYTSIGANVGFSRDFNRKNTTLSASFAFSHDLVSPEGGAPRPMSSMTAEVEDDEHAEDEEAFEGSREGLDESKDVFDAVFGVTQVLDRSTLVRFNYSFNFTTGYLSDPYKAVSVVQSRTGPEPGEPVDYLFESRPDERTKHALFAEMRRHISGHTIDLSYRFFWDDWGVTSHTVDLYYRLPLPAGHALQPHLRWYRQTEADFYRTYLISGGPLSAHASADYRLAPFHAITAGLQYLLPIADNTNFSIGAEYYLQSGDVDPPTGLGALSRYDLFPDMKAIMVRAGVSYDL